MFSTGNTNFKLPLTRLTLRTIPRPLTIRASSSFYHVLGVSESGSLLEIKHAYKQMARKYHPDLSPKGRAEEYTERFIQVREAYETLSDPKRRAVYDGGDVARGVGFAFSAPRHRCTRDQEVQDKGEWKNRWQMQLSELKKRTTHKNPRGNKSWGEKMQRQTNDSSNEA